MRVLVISHMYPSTFDEIAGVFVHQQVRELQTQGCEAKVISATPLMTFPLKHLSKKWKRYSEIPAKTARDGVEVYYPRYLAFPRAMFFASSGSRMYSGIRRLVADLYREFQFDLIHAHVALPDGFAGTILKRDYGKPLVVTIHGQDLQVTVDRNAACHQALTNVFAEADRVVVVSTKLRTVAEASFGFLKNLVVINNGIDPEEIISGTIERPAQYRDRRRILSVCNLIPTKGVDLNIRAVSRLAAKYPDLKYLVIGGGSEASYLRRLACDLNLEGRVEFLGALPHNEVMEYMAAADVFSLPSWREGFGVVYLEAMAHGKPVIACEGEGIADVVDHGKTGLLVKPKDVESLAQAMDFLLSDPEQAQEIGERAQKLVVENYTWEVNARTYMGIYRELLAARC